MTDATDTRRIYVAGEEGSPLKSVTGKPVRIEDIRATCSRDRPFMDPDFLPIASSIGDVGGDVARKDNQAPPEFKWARPHEICKTLCVEKPDFAVAQASGYSKYRISENDVVQGYLADCWYVAALQALAKKPEQLALVIPEDNHSGFDDDNYCGAFHFRFYDMTDSKWVDIVVDDLLPVTKLGTPVFAGVQTTVGGGGYAEFWVALIEKAYAKLHRSYKGIEMGMACHALENMCGGFSEYLFLKAPSAHGLAGQLQIDCYLDPATVIRTMLLNLVGSARNTFLALGSYGPGNQEFDSDGYNKYGLIGPHVYTILDVQDVPFKAPLSGSRVLVKIRNPHGTHEWTGAFSDRDDYNWNQMTLDLRARDESGSTDVDEGSFWMDIKDMIQYFYTLQVCYFNGTAQMATALATVKGVWTSELRTVPYPPTPTDLLRFKAYKFQVSQGPLVAQYGDEVEGKAVLCFTLVLHGYNSTYNSKPIFFANLYKMESPDEELDVVLKRKAVHEEQSVAREASAWTFVDPGWYVLVPCLYTALEGGVAPFPPELDGKELIYTLRVFTENETKLEEMSKAPRYEDLRPIPPDELQKLVDTLRKLGIGDEKLAELGFK